MRATAKRTYIKSKTPRKNPQEKPPKKIETYEKPPASIVIDILGGDNAPGAIIDGVILAGDLMPELTFVLVGDQKVIKPKIASAGMTERVEIVHTTENIGFDETPTSVKSRPTSSIAMAFDALRVRKDVGAFVSAGNTGAVLAGAVLKLGRVPGVARPGMCPLMPTKIPGQKFITIDVGANMDCRPLHLLHFAIMGAEYMKSRGVKNPRVALVNVGTEDTKGNELTLDAFKMLQKTDLNFVGNMEAREAFSGNYDVIVCDGFVGNILLKTAEGVFTLFGKKLRGALTATTSAKIGALLVKKGLEEIKKEFSHDEVGGSLFLGTKKPVVKAHGSSGAYAFFRAIMLAVEAMSADLCTNIEAAIARNKHAGEYAGE